MISNPRSDANRLWRAAVVCLAMLVLVWAEYAVLTEEPRDVEAAGAKRFVLTAFGDGVPIAQTFTMNRGGLEVFGVQLSASRPVSLRIEGELLQLRPDAQQHPDMLEAYDLVERRTMTMAANAGVGWHTIEFQPLASSNGRIHQVRLRLTGVEGTARRVAEDREPPLELGVVASRDNALGGGMLLIDGAQEWGDLVYFARAEGRTRYERLRTVLHPALPGVLRQPLVQLALLLLYNIALVGVLYHVLVRVDRRERLATGALVRDAGQLAGRGASGGAPRTQQVVTALAMAAIIGGLLWQVRRDVGLTHVDLIHELDTAAQESPLGLHRAFRIEDETINGRRLRAIFAHPPSRIAWPVTIPPQGALRTQIALMSRMWELFGDGVTFRVGLSDGETYDELYARHVNPVGRLEDRYWIPVDIDLAPYAGRRLELVFETLAGPANDESNDWALWGAPRIVIR